MTHTGQTAAHLECVNSTTIAQDSGREVQYIPVLLRLRCVLAVVEESPSCRALLVSDNSSEPIVVGLQELPKELTLAVPSPRKLPPAPPSG